VNNRFDEHEDRPLASVIDVGGDDAVPRTYPRGMRSSPRRRASRGDATFTVKPRNSVPHAFVLEALDAAAPGTKPMFGLLAIYVKDRIVLILRDRKDHPADNGVWLATTEEHHASLKREFPSMRSLGEFEGGVTGWQVLPADSDDFEEAARHACELIIRGDPRIGKVPGSRRPTKLKAATRKTRGNHAAPAAARRARRATRR
jgi:hypothetical protein